MTQNQLVGTWQLVSWENTDADNQISYPFGQDAVGYIIYTEDGYMSVNIMRTNRPKVAAGEPLGRSIEEQAATAQAYFSYCGQYKIQTNKVIHSVEASLFPNWVGLDQERFFELKGNLLSLSSVSLLKSGKQQTHHLVWQGVGT